MNPFAKLESQVAAADAATAAAYATQEAERSAIRARLAELDAVTSPLRGVAAQLRAELEAQRRVAIGPWVAYTPPERRWQSATLRLYGTDPQDGWSRRAWLRVRGGLPPKQRSAAEVQHGIVPAAVDEWRWFADIYSVAGPTIELDFGPPTADPRADFEQHKRAVEAKCRELGYYVVSDPGQESSP